MIRGRDRLLGEFEALYVESFASYVRVARAITGDREQAVEAVQEGFARAMAARASFRGASPLGAWVWRIILNEARNQSRRPLSDAAYERGEAELPARAAELAPLISALPERQRHAIFLRYYADLDYRTIAAVLDIEVGTVSATLAAAHQRLRTALREQEVTAND
ncbi:MAG: sigma-70 family RNA polymerase sigma factor [Gaiellaceae bacterium]